MRALALIPLILLAACGSEPTFDERYEGAEQQINHKAETLEKDLGPEGDRPSANKAGSPAQ